MKVDSHRTTFKTHKQKARSPVMPVHYMATAAPWNVHHFCTQPRLELSLPVLNLACNVFWPGFASSSKGSLAHGFLGAHLTRLHAMSGREGRGSTVPGAQGAEPAGAGNASEGPSIYLGTCTLGGPGLAYPSLPLNRLAQPGIFFNWSKQQSLQ